MRFDWWKKSLLFIMSVLSVSLTGCATAAKQPEPLFRAPYEKMEYQTTEVKRGDLQGNLTLKLQAEGYREVAYRAPAEKKEAMEIKVQILEPVKKGQLLVSFQTPGELGKTEEYRAKKQEEELLLQHYQKLMELDKELDYEEDIRLLQEDIQVAELYIEEQKQLAERDRILAEEQGIITGISEYARNGVCEPGVELVTMVTGTGRYLGSTENPELFAEGEIYTVQAGEQQYELKLMQVDGNSLIFEKSNGSGLVCPEEFLSLTMAQPEKKDVVYVDRHAICSVPSVSGGEEAFCVYILSDTGYQRAVFVTPGDRVGEYMIIKDGLQGGERAVIR